jgi:hypothetical protein
VRAFAPGFQTATLGPFDPALVDGHLELALHAGSAVRGRVIHGGSPVENARLCLMRSAPPDSHAVSGFLDGVTDPETPFDILMTAARGGADGTTDARGEFCLILPDDGWYALHVEADGFPATSFGPFEWTCANGASGLELPLRRSGAIVGRVRVPSHVRPETLVVGASNGSGTAWTTRVAADGTFRISGIAPGGWQVRRCLPPVADVQPLQAFRLEDQARPVRYDCVVEPGGEAWVVLDLELLESVELAGQMALAASDTSIWRFRLIATESSSRMPIRPVLRQGQLDSEGRFAARLSRPCTCVLQLERYGSDDERLDFYYVVQRLDLRTGVQRCDFDLDLVAVTFALDARGPEEPVPAYFFSDLAGGARFVHPLRRDDEDAERLMLPQTFLVPSGRGRFVVPSNPPEWGWPNFLGDAWTTLAEVTLARSEPSRIELR